MIDRHEQAFIADWQTELGGGWLGSFFGSNSSLPAPAMSCETSLSNRGFILTFVTSTVTSEGSPRQLAGQTSWLDE